MNLLTHHASFGNRQKEVEIRKTKEATQEKKKLRHAALPAEVC